MNHFHLLTLLVVQLTLVLIVQAGIFDFAAKQKHKNERSSVSAQTDNQQSLRLDPHAAELADELDSLENSQPRRRRGSPINPDKSPKNANADLCDLLLRANQNGMSYRNPKHEENVAEDLREPVIADILVESNTIKETPKKPFRPTLARPKDIPAAHSKSMTMPKICSAGFLKKKIKGAYTSTKHGLKPVAKAFKDIPKYATQATESVTTLLNLDNKGRIAAMIEATDNDMKFIRNEYSKFAISWSPLMEAALNYVGKEDLYHLKWNDCDEFDLRRDAINSLAIGYEFMSMMISWRENLLVAHAAFKNYIEAFKQDMLERKDIVIDDYLIYQLESIHSYMLFKSWLQIDAEIVEPTMKLVHLLDDNDERTKNYESDYFRHIVFYHELFDPTLEEFATERTQVLNAIGIAGDLAEEFKEVDQFLIDFQDQYANDEELRKTIEVPEIMSDFMEEIRPQIRFNPRVYGAQKLKDLKAILKV